MTSEFFYFTWSPNPAKYPFSCPKLQFEQSFRDLRIAISCWDKWALSPECNSNGNIHYHGYFSFKDKDSYKVRWYSKGLPKLKYNGLVKINKVHTKLDDTYMTKQRFIMQQVLGYVLPIKHAKLIPIHDVERQMCDEFPLPRYPTDEVVYDPETNTFVNVYTHVPPSNSEDSPAI